MNKLLTLLRCAAHGEKTIFQTPAGDYVSIQVKGRGSLEPRDAEEVDIESRIQFELYGEYFV